MSQSGLNVDFLEILRRLSALIQSSLDALLDRRQVRNARRADTPSDLSQFFKTAFIKGHLDRGFK
jgi:hypothetical protein